MLVALAALAFAFIFFFERHWRQPGDAAASSRVLPQLNPAAVRTVQVRPAGKLEIRADRTNDTWQLTKPVVQPAEAAAVESLLQTLQTLSGQSRLTTQDLKAKPRAAREFGFDPPQFSILVQQSDYLGQLLVGNRTPLRDQVFLQVVGADGIYLVDAALLRLIPLSANDWRGRALLRPNELAYDRVAVTNGAMGFELERAPATKLWRLIRPMDARADTPRIDDLLRTLQGLRAAAFVSDDARADLDAFGLQPPSLEVFLARGTNTLAGLQFGRSPTNDPSRVYARRAGQSSVVLVPQEAIAPWRAAYTDFRDRHLVALTPNVVDELEVSGAERFVVRRQTNDLWQITGTNGFAADPALVEVLLGTLGTLEIGQFVKDVVTPLDFPSYGLQPPALQFTLRTAAPHTPGVGTNRVIAELQFGAAQGEIVFARRADENAVYGVRVRDFQRLPAAAWQLRDRRIWQFTENDVTKLALRLEGKLVELGRAGTNQWSLPAGAPATLNELALDETMHRLGDLTAVAWAGRGNPDRGRFGFTEKSSQILVELKSGAKLSLEFGGLSSRALPLAAVVIDGQPCIFEFPWTIFQYLQTYLGIAPTKP
jgi:hypothetical protein